MSTTAAGHTSPSDNDVYGVNPEPAEIIEDSAERRIIVRTRYYEVEHSLAHGGAISAIRLTKLGDENLLTAPCGLQLDVVGAARGFVPGPAPRVEISREGTAVQLSFTSPLQDADGNLSGAELCASYLHRWGHVRLHQELRFPAQGLEVRRLLMHSFSVVPALTHYGLRPGAPAEASAYPGAFGVCQWGRFAPGRTFDSSYDSRYVPRYVCVAEPGRRGLEWFVGSELGQWDYQVAGEPGHGSLRLAAQTSPPGVAVSVCPLDLPVGSLTLSRTLLFDSYVGIPIISGRAHQPFVHTAFNRKPWPADDKIAEWARRGIRTAHFHHDGDSFRDGQFWRDGTYPPFAPDDMAQFDRVIATCHRHGIRVATYFSNKELHPSVQAYQDHGAEWARLPDDRGQQIHNHYSGDEYGAQMCLRSGWLDFLKQYIDTVLSHHDLDGTYYDWNVALYCHNSAHVGMAPLPPGMGAQAGSPAGHWDMDELLDLMQWTRERVGPEGLAIVHNTMVPMAATENYADYVVAMEWGYSKLALAAPALDALPLEWSFMGARSRGVIGYGCLEPEAPERVHRQMTLRCLLTGVVPWPARELDLDMFAPLAGRDLSGARFLDWRNTVATVHEPDAATAVYCGEGQLLALVGDLRGEARTVCCTLDLTGTGVCEASAYRVGAGAETQVVAADDLRTVCLPVTVPADGVALIVVEPL